MDITGQATQAGIWQRIKIQHIALVGGLAVAASAALAAGGWESGKGSSAATATRAPEVPVYQSSETPRVVFFIVGSQEHAAILEAANSDPSLVKGNLSLHILVADSPEAEARAHYLIDAAAQELADHGALIETVDLRSR